MYPPRYLPLAVEHAGALTLNIRNPTLEPERAKPSLYYRRHTSLDQWQSGRLGILKQGGSIIICAIYCLNSGVILVYEPPLYFSTRVWIQGRNMY